jgi:uncharacterized protein YqgV (UPF0045/DUF77 family)
MIVAFSVTPLGVGEGVSGAVAPAVQLERAVNAAEPEVASWVSVVLKADIRPGANDGLTRKVELLVQKLAEL